MFPWHILCTNKNEVVHEKKQFPMQRFAICLRLIDKDTSIKQKAQTLKIKHYENYNDY